MKRAGAAYHEGVSAAHELALNQPALLEEGEAETVGLRYQDSNNPDDNTRQRLKQLHHAHVVATSAAKFSEQQVTEAHRALKAATKTQDKLVRKGNKTSNDDGTSSIREAAVMTSKALDSMAEDSEWTRQQQVKAVRQLLHDHFAEARKLGPRRADRAAQPTEYMHRLPSRGRRRHAWYDIEV